jgi:hypothetical protein
MKKEFMSNDYPEIVGLYIDSHIFGKDFYDSVQDKLTLEGKVVIKINHEIFPEEKMDEMEKLSYKKIDLIDTLQVETISMHKNEKRDKFIEYAKQKGKGVIIK